MTVSGESVVQCERCSAPLKVNPERNPDARLLRHADHGVCANCATTAFLKSMEPLASVLAAKGPALLLGPAVQEQAARMLDAGNADADPSEIDWQTVVAQWEIAR